MGGKQVIKRVFVLATILVVGSLVVASIYAVSVVSASDAALGSARFAAGVSGWKSGWVSIPQGTCQVFNHNLGGKPEEYAVELLFREEPGAGSIGIHPRFGKQRLLLDKFQTPKIEREES